MPSGDSPEPSNHLIRKRLAHLDIHLEGKEIEIVKTNYVDFHHMYTPRDVIWYFKQNGIRQTLWRIYKEVLPLIIGIVLGIHDRIYTTDGDSLCVIPRESVIDQDTIGIITQNDGQFKQIFVVVSDPMDLNQSEVSEYLSDYQFQTVETMSLEFIRAMSISGTVILKDRLWQYWLLSDNSKTFVKIPHGISTKEPIPSKIKNCSIMSIIANKVGLTKNYEITVASQVEHHRRAGVLGRNQENIKIYGYPRYDRIRHLVDNPDETMLPEATKDDLISNNRGYNILYAPSHKDGAFKTNLFPFIDYNQDSLKEFLKNNNINIYIRMHIFEESSGIADEYIDGENIHYAGHGFAHSAAEMMPYFDALVTDYSSIYLDYVLFDRPIIFVQDNLKKFEDLRGFAFDYNTHWPGPKIKTQRQFMEMIEQSVIEVDDDDDYSYQRRFVRDTFHPSLEKSFIENISDLST